MMIKKVEFFLLRVQLGKPRISGVFCGSSHFSASQHPRTPPKLQNSSIWVSYDIPPNFKPRYWHENFSLEENQNIQLMLSQMFGLF